MKDVDPRVFIRMLRKDGRTEGRTEGRWKKGRTDGSVTISLRNLVGEGIIRPKFLSKLQTLSRITGFGQN